MKMRKKGKVYPSPSPSSSSSSSTHSSGSATGDAMSVLKLLPATILALATVLSLEDREVLAYIITRSLKSSNPLPIVVEKEKSKNSKRSSATAHRSPVFDCGCFDCYTSYWFRWDSSPNRELIHQAIEAFEEHLATGETAAKRSNRSKRRDKMSRRAADRVASTPEIEADAAPEISDGSIEVSPEKETSASPVAESPPEKVAETEWSEGENVEEEAGEESPEEEAASPSPTTSHKGLVRKVLPDVLGLFNSRLWSLWSPNV